MSTPRILLAFAVAACGCAPQSKPTSVAPTLASAPVTSKPAPLASPRHFAGSVALPGVELAFFVELQREGEAWRGTIDIPMQGLHKAALDDVVVEGARVAFGIAKVGARWSVTLDGEGDPDVCKLEQGGHTLECGLSAVDPARYAELTAVKRPQTPKPPFPYEALDVVVHNTASKLELAGTLTIPLADGPHPVVLLVTGSGAQDRDETIFDHKPFLVLADHLARHGIAALRLDDRGIGGSGGDPKTSTTADFVGDAVAAVAFLRSQPRIDPARVGILGHSEGAIVAPAAAATSKDVAFIVMLAGTGVPGSEILLDQTETFARAAGKSDADVARLLDLQRELFAAVRSTNDDAQLRTTLRPLLARQPEVEGKAIDAELEVLLSPWYRHFVAYDPGPSLRKLKIPVLVLNGELDRQVDAELNVPAISRALRKAGNRRFTVHRLAGINHLFQRAKTGMVDEYAAIEETIAPEVLALISGWILGNTNPQGKKSPSKLNPSTR